ncbi:SCO7613 C-terminal domain-containing membrane protein [Nocardioides sp. GXZ039]|uniref:SCO7613 C-terminal domain-containing membrane protein n=1 Tax=Nocardioides sp. GXZ039 TaxID=3136018 RepID=UPI0030F487E2
MPPVLTAPATSRPAFTYADPHACPACRSSLAAMSATDRHCPRCGVPLDDALADQAFALLTDADRLVARLRAVAPAAMPQPAPAGYPVRIPPGLAPVPPVPPMSPMSPRAPRGVRVSSVPAILLGLGALCLLVAAVTFLAVAWSWLGVGGRTAVLVALTAATAAGGVALRRRGLRLAAEALVAVSLGLLILDVVGAIDAGWLGDLHGAGTAVVLGTVLAGGAAAFLLTDGRLVAPWVGLVGGLYLAQAALPGLAREAGIAWTGIDLLVAGAAALGFVALAGLGRRLGSATAVVGAIIAATLAWLDLTVTALVAIVEDDGHLAPVTIADVWGTVDGVALVVAALLLLTPIAFGRKPAQPTAWVAASGSVLSAVVALPVADNGTTAVSAVSLALGLLWTLVALVLPGRIRLAALVPASLVLVPATLVAGALTIAAVAVALSPDAGLRLDPSVVTSEADVHPWPIVPTVLAVALLLAALVPGGVGELRTRTAAWARGVGAATAVGSIATLALHPVPLWTVVALSCLISTAFAADAVRSRGTAAAVQGIGAGVALGAAALVAAPDHRLLMLPLTLLTAYAALTILVGRFGGAAELGGVVLAPSATALVWTVADVVGLEVAVTAVPALLVVAVIVMLRPRAEAEVPAALAAVASCLVAVPAAEQVGISVALSAALHLTLAGALVTADSLVHPSRRRLAWVGGSLLVLATWVRLAELGIGAPEPYTLPAATALVIVGLLRLRRDPTASTRLALFPGLTLATVPSLLRALETDPVSVRAAVLGLSCLLLVLLGARLRWSAPLIVGAAVGAILALAELAPYAAQTPQWVVIGLSGTTLIVMGITWERRVRDLRRAMGYLGRLR